MIVRVLLGAFVSAVLLMGFGFFWWGSPMGPMDDVIRPVANEERLAAAIQDEVPESGFFVVPMPPDAMEGPEFERWQERHRRGPVARISVLKEGADPDMVPTMLLGFLHYFASAVLAAALLAALKPPTFGGRWTVVFFLGVFAAVFVNLADLVWWQSPPGMPVGGAAYSIIGWAIGALPIALVVRPRPPAEPAFD